MTPILLEHERHHAAHLGIKIYHTYIDKYMIGNKKVRSFSTGPLHLLVPLGCVDTSFQEVLVFRSS